MLCYTLDTDEVSPRCGLSDELLNPISAQIFCYISHTDEVSPVMPVCVFKCVSKFPFCVNLFLHNAH